MRCKLLVCLRVAVVMHMNRKSSCHSCQPIEQDIYSSQLQLLRLNWVVLVLPHRLISLGCIPSCLLLIDTTNRALTYPPFWCFFHSAYPSGRVPTPETGCLAFSRWVLYHPIQVTPFSRDYNIRSQPAPRRRRPVARGPRLPSHDAATPYWKQVSLPCTGRSRQF
jgi:hypothetical protein